MSSIEIDSFALMRNVRTVRDAVGEGVKIFAVVKANACGHNLEIASEAFWRGGVDGFVVTEVADALMLSQKAYRVPILLLNPPLGTDIGKLVALKIRFAGVSKEFLDALSSVAARQGTRALVHLEVETGMHRFGVAPQEVLPIIEAATQPRSPLILEGMFTHLYDPTNEEISQSQIASINDILFRLQQKTLPIPMVHVLASYGFLRYPDALFDAVRLGRLLYGLSEGDFHTDPALKWKTNIISIMKVRRGETIGYGATYTSDRERSVGVLPVGYSDGLDRRLSNSGFVLVQNRRCPIVGRICMNNTMIDLSPVLRPQVGDEVVLLGEQGQHKISAAEMAEWAGTIDYEILTRISAHIPRIKIR